MTSNIIHILELRVFSYILGDWCEEVDDNESSIRFMIVTKSDLCSRMKNCSVLDENNPLLH